MAPKISVQIGDILEFESDVLVLKYAQYFYGVDKITSEILKKNINIKKMRPKVNTYSIVHNDNLISSVYTLFIGVNSIGEFRYDDIRKFGYDSLKIVSEELPETRHISMTIHGVGFGLDEREGFKAQIAGILDAIYENNYPKKLQFITIIEHDKQRAKRLIKYLNNILNPYLHGPFENNYEKILQSSYINEAGIKSDEKPHVFVAMPFNETMEDIYYYGIERPVSDLGYLCERIDLIPFTGGILEKIKERISTAKVVIAVLTETNPNVYLEVGYAWGKEVPTILLANNTECLKFDVKNQRCIIYKSIRHMEKEVKRELSSVN